MFQIESLNSPEKNESFGLFC